MPGPEACSPTTSARRNLSAEEVAKAKALFQGIDLDSSGTIDLNELSTMFKGMNYDLTDTDVMEVMTALDQDEDGVITFTEFLRGIAMKKVMDLTAKTDARDVAAAFEECGGKADGSGSINVRNVSTLLEAFGVEVDATAMFGEVMDYQQFSSIFSL